MARRSDHVAVHGRRDAPKFLLERSDALLAPPPQDLDPDGCDGFGRGLKSLPALHGAGSSHHKDVESTQRDLDGQLGHPVFLRMELPIGAPEPKVDPYDSLEPFERLERIRVDGPLVVLTPTMGGGTASISMR
jgi:hypothetical protein